MLYHKRLSILFHITHLEPFTRLPAPEKLTNKQLIVIVQSRPHRSSIRKSIRESWGETGKNF